jgi:uncharacterized protein YecE (DUF72 family)
MARLHVGLPQLEGSISAYAEKFDMVELGFEPGAAPKPSTLRGWRREISPSFAVSLRLPRIVGDLPMTKEMDKALDEAIASATALEARAILLVTSAEVRPTQATTEKLRSLVARLPKPSVLLCWEPRGIWERREMISVARDVGLLPVVDAQNDPLPAGPVAYTRLRALGGAQRVSQRATEKMANELQNKREAWIVVEHAPSARRIRQEISHALSRLNPSQPPPARPVPGRLRAEDEEQ